MELNKCCSFCLFSPLIMALVPHQTPHPLPMLLQSFIMCVCVCVSRCEGISHPLPKFLLPGVSRCENPKIQMHDLTAQTGVRRSVFFLPTEVHRSVKSGSSVHE